MIKGRARKRYDKISIFRYKYGGMNIYIYIYIRKNYIFVFIVYIYIDLDYNIFFVEIFFGFDRPIDWSNVSFVRSA